MQYLILLFASFWILIWKSVDMRNHNIGTDAPTN